MKYLLLSHCFIKDDSEFFKVEIFNFVINYFKSKYKDITIIITGHGIDNFNHLISSDHLMWIPFTQSEIGYGHPICVEMGYKLAKNLGAKKILKMRLDSLSVHEDIFGYCDDILVEEKKECLITSQTNLNGLIGDLFMYGDIDFLISIWKPDRWIYNMDGMGNLNNIFHQNYKSSIKEKFSYRDNKSLKWIFLKSDDFQIIKNSNLGEKYEDFLWDKYYGSYINEEFFYNK